MSGRRRSCGDNHRFQEHGIGAGLTRKVCVMCGELGIGEAPRFIAIEKELSTAEPALVNAG
jgi:hypothetical protein